MLRSTADGAAVCSAACAHRSGEHNVGQRKKQEKEEKMICSTIRGRSPPLFTRKPGSQRRELLIASCRRQRCLFGSYRPALAPTVKFCGVSFKIVCMLCPRNPANC